MELPLIGGAVGHHAVIKWDRHVPHRSNAITGKENLCDLSYWIVPQLYVASGEPYIEGRSIGTRTVEHGQGGGDRPPHGVTRRLGHLQTRPHWAAPRDPHLSFPGLP